VAYERLVDSSILIVAMDYLGMVILPFLIAKSRSHLMDLSRSAGEINESR